jgi:hypothetical protein
LSGDITNRRPDTLYRGAYAATSRRTWDPDDAGASPVEVVTCIDADADPDLLAQLGAGELNAPATGSSRPPRVSVVVHSPSRRLLVLVLPDDDPRHGLHQRIAFQRALLAEVDAIPRYVLEHHVAIAPFGPRDLDRIARITRPGDSPPQPLAPKQPHALPPSPGQVACGPDDAVTVEFRCPRERLASFVEGRTELLLQLHCLPTYPIIALVLAALDAAERDVDELCCVLDLRDPRHLHILGLLQRRFAVTCRLIDERGDERDVRRFERPLGGNAAYILDRAASWLDRLPPHRRDRGAAEALFLSAGYERIGARRHTLHKDSFSDLPTIGATRLAVSMVGYWTEPQNFDSLIQNRSFPLQWFRAIQRRVLRAGLRFGLYLPPDLRACAVRQQMAADEASLLAELVTTFTTRATTRPDTVELDPIALSENWDQLLSAAVDLDIPIPDASRALADQARRRSRRGKGEVTGVAPPPPAPPRQPTPPPTRVSRASTEALRRLLAEGGAAPAASRELLGRGGETNIFMVIEAAPVLAEDELETTARILAAGAEQFEPALLMGLGRPAPKTVHLCALALAMAQRVEALPALIELMHDPERGGPIPIREIVACYGESAIPSLFEAIEDRGASPALIEALALISIDHAAAIIAALRERSSPALLAAAQKLSEVRRGLGGRRLRAGRIAPGEGDET